MNNLPEPRITQSGYNQSYTDICNQGHFYPELTGAFTPQTGKSIYNRKRRIVQLAIIQAQFEIVHPFLDGNWRVGLILVPLFLYEKGLLSEQKFYNSSYLEGKREYSTRLENISKSEDWNKWIILFLEAVSKQAETNHEQAQEALNAYERRKDTRCEATKTQYSIKAVDAIFEKPVFKRLGFNN